MNFKSGQTCAGCARQAMENLRPHGNIDAVELFTKWVAGNKTVNIWSRIRHWLAIVYRSSACLEVAWGRFPTCSKDLVYTYCAPQWPWNVNLSRWWGQTFIREENPLLHLIAALFGNLQSCKLQNHQNVCFINDKYFIIAINYPRNLRYIIKNYSPNRLQGRFNELVKDLLICNPTLRVRVFL